MTDGFDQLRPAAMELARLLEWGCSDGSCRLVKRHRGQVTNGGCKCLRHLAELSLIVAAGAEAVRYKATGEALLTKEHEP